MSFSKRAIFGLLCGLLLAGNASAASKVKLLKLGSSASKASSLEHNLKLSEQRALAAEKALKAAMEKSRNELLKYGAKKK